MPLRYARVLDSPWIRLPLPLFSRPRHPQDFVLPVSKQLTFTDVSAPHSHLHRHLLWLYLFLPSGNSAVRRVKTIPVMSFVRATTVSMTRHPQDRDFPRCK